LVHVCESQHYYLVFDPCFSFVKLSEEEMLKLKIKLLREELISKQKLLFQGNYQYSSSLVNIFPNKTLLCQNVSLKNGPFKIFSAVSTINNNHYSTSLRRVQITPKTSKNIMRYLYSRGPVRQVFLQRASDKLDRSYEKNFVCQKEFLFHVFS